MEVVILELERKVVNNCDIMSGVKNTGVKQNVKRVNWKFYDEILETADIRPFIDCMTCGKCVGDCIAAKNSEFNFRKIIQSILDGDKEKLINGTEIWKCFLCGLCTIKCPKKIEIKKLILFLRKLALDSGKGYDLLKHILNLPESFMKKGLVIGRIDTNLREKLGLPKEFQLSDKTLKEVNLLLEETGQKKSIEDFMNRCKKAVAEGDKK